VRAGERESGRAGEREKERKRERESEAKSEGVLVFTDMFFSHDVT
jgi:mannose/fructose-specific phosphotransferase system component IIA